MRYLLEVHDRSLFDDAFRLVHGGGAVVMRDFLGSKR
jgi:hypothetical protein